MGKMTIDDFRVTEDGTVIDWWKMKDDYKNQKLRKLTRAEYLEAVKESAEISKELGYCTFTEAQLDSSLEREYPDDVPPICPACKEYMETLWWNESTTYEFKDGKFVERDGDGTVRCPHCESKCAGDVVEEGPLNYTSEQMQEYLERECGGGRVEP